MGPAAPATRHHPDPLVPSKKTPDRGPTDDRGRPIAVSGQRSPGNGTADSGSGGVVSGQRVRLSGQRVSGQRRLGPVVSGRNGHWDDIWGGIRATSGRPDLPTGRPGPRSDANRDRWTPRPSFRG